MNEVILAAQSGLCVHPLKRRDKRPLLDKWGDAATTDITKIAEWSAMFPDCNWGAVTGTKSGIVVIDVDASHGGLESWTELTHGKVLKTPTCLTGGGGLHIYFRLPPNTRVRNSASKIAPGIDVRGDGGQVVIPPSIHPSGELYKWKTGMAPWEIDFIPVPVWLMRLLRSVSSWDGPALGETLVVGERNDNIYHYALALARLGSAAEFILSVMRNWVREQGYNDISDDEIRRTVESAIKKATAEGVNGITPADFIRSDADNAERLVRECKGDFIYIRGMGWYYWDGLRWNNKNGESQIIRKAINVMEKVADEAREMAKDQNLRARASAQLRWAIQSKNLSRVRAMIALASTHPDIERMSGDIDPPETAYYLNFLNGVLDLRTGNLLPHAREYMITKLINYKYNPDAKCPVWEDSVRTALGGDEELISFFQRALGYSVSGDVSAQCFFICWGPDGNNGKSTMFEALQRIIGPDYVRPLSIEALTGQRDSSYVSTDLARMPGVRLAPVGEADVGHKFNSQTIKDITGGDTIKARFMREATFEYVPVFKVWMRTNYKPATHDLSPAFLRRVKIIPFEHQIPPEKRKDPRIIHDELDNEAEGILAWLVRGFREYWEHGLGEPQRIKAAVSEYVEENDLVKQFLNECTVEGGKVKASVLYSTFVAWCKENGYKFMLNSRAFGTRVGRILAARGLQSTVSGGRTVWVGISLTDEMAMQFGILG